MAESPDSSPRPAINPNPNTMTTTHDFIVIGGGSGGIAAARRAAEYGARTLLFEPARLGGTCVNVGCVPKKVMWNAAQIHHALELAGDYGFRVEQQGFRWSTLKTARDAYVARLNRIYADNLEAAGVDLIRAAARLGGDGRVEAGGKTHRARHILIATGGRPTVPELPGAELAITSDGFFDLAAQPVNPLIIGAGYIATEFAGMLHGMGSRVTVLLRKDRLLRAFDPVLGDTVMAQMQAGGVDIRCGVLCSELYRADDGSLGYRSSNGSAGNGNAGNGNARGDSDSGFDCVIFAISRRPAVEALALENAGLAPDGNGFIAVDECQNTAADGVYAVGDVTPATPLTPVAIAAGRRLADRLFGGQPQARLDFDNIPTVVFSHPPIGTVGLSQARAAEVHGAQHIKVYQSRFVNMRYALGEHKPPTVMKLITAGPQERVVGCHVVGDGADEMMQGFAVALKMGATKADFDNTIAIHPTAAEELVTMR